MENKSERVLAYSKAKLITADELSAISGGTFSTVKQTVRASAAHQSSLDVTVDHILDG